MRHPQNEYIQTLKTQRGNWSLLRDRATGEWLLIDPAGRLRDRRFTNSIEAIAYIAAEQVRNELL